MKFQVLINEFYPLKNEPFRVVRFLHENKSYLMGLERTESWGIKFKRQERGYHKPTKRLEQLIKREIQL